MPSDYTNTIKAERIARGWTQDEAAQRIGCSRPTLNKIENHRRQPSIDFVYDAAAAFEMPIEALFKREKRSVVQSVLKAATADAQHLGLLILIWFVAAQLVGRAALAAVPYVQNDGVRIALGAVGTVASSPIEGFWAARSALDDRDTLTADECQQFLRHATAVSLAPDNPFAVTIQNRTADCFDKTGQFGIARTERETALRLELLHMPSYYTDRMSQVAVFLALTQAAHALQYGDRATASALLGDARATSASWTKLLLGELAYFRKPSRLFGDTAGLLQLAADPDARAVADFTAAQNAFYSRHQTQARILVNRAFDEAPRTLPTLLAFHARAQPNSWLRDRTARDDQEVAALRTRP